MTDTTQPAPRVPVVDLRPKAGAPRAVRVPAEGLSFDDVDELASFCFEYFTEKSGVFRLYITGSDDADESVRDDEHQRVKKLGAPLLLDDRDRCIQPVHPGDWLVEPHDGGSDGFLVLTPAEFDRVYEVITK